MNSWYGFKSGEYLKSFQLSVLPKAVNRSSLLKESINESEINIKWPLLREERI
jgi:hypothetical protein